MHNGFTENTPKNIETEVKGFDLKVNYKNLYES